jgi:hypothetical protein
MSLPVSIYGWTSAEYVNWIDCHDEKDVLGIIRAAMTSYLNKVEKENRKETCLELPVLRSVVLDWENI